MLLKVKSTLQNTVRFYNESINKNNDLFNDILKYDLYH